MSKLVRGKNDLKTINPQLADEWHPTKNGTLQPTDVVYGSGKKLGGLSLMMIRLQGNILILNGKQLYQAVVKEQAVPF